MRYCFQERVDSLSRVQVVRKKAFVNADIRATNFEKEIDYLTRIHLRSFKSIYAGFFRLFIFSFRLRLGILGSRSPANDGEGLLGSS